MDVKFCRKIIYCEQEHF